MASYVEFRVKSLFSFGEGASHVSELISRAVELNYPTLALTDTNLCGALEFARLANRMGIRPITGGQITLKDGSRVTLLAKDRRGYGNLSQLFTLANFAGRRSPVLDPKGIPDHAEGLVLITGCADSTVSRLVVDGQHGEAECLVRDYQDWFGPDAVYVGLQQNRVRGDTTRNHKLVEFARHLDVPLVTTNDVHYHLPARHKLQNVLTAIKNNSTIGEVVHLLKSSDEFHLRSHEEMTRLFSECPEAVKNTAAIAEICNFDLSKDLGYRLPVPEVPEGYTPDTYLQRLCYEAAQRRYGGLPDGVKERLSEEFRLFRKHNLSGFLLLYRDIALIANEIMIEEGRTPPETPIEERPPGRSRGSSVALLTGYLIGISHVDPLTYRLTLERFLPEDLKMLPDIDLDFPRRLRDKLIRRVHQRYGPEHAVLAGAISTYKIKGIIADVGKALGLPEEALRRLSRTIHSYDPSMLRQEMLRIADFQGRTCAQGWRDLIELAPQLAGAPKGLGQHVGGLILSSTPITEMVPIREGAMEGRYIMDWDRDSVADAGFAKIDVLSLPVLDQIDDILDLAERQTSKRIDLSRIGQDDSKVWDMINEGKTIGVFLLQSPAQLKVSQRMRSRNLNDLAYQVALIRPGVGVQGSAVNKFIARYRHGEQWEYDHPLQKRALERTYGIIVWQEQVVQLLADIGGMSTAEADEIRRGFAKPNNASLLTMYKKRFMKGAGANGVPEDVAERTWSLINGYYMFPESHSYAFGINALQAAWLKAHYPTEFFVSLMNNLPMGFYPAEVVKQDARRFGVRFRNPEVNESSVDCIPLDGCVLLGFRFIKDVGNTLALAVTEERRAKGPFEGVGDFVRRLHLKPEAMQSLVLAGAFDSLAPNRRVALWEAGLYDGPASRQLPLPINLDHEVPELPDFTDYQKALAEYSVLGLYPQGHLLQFLRPQLKGIWTAMQVEESSDGEHVTVAGWIVARQHPRGETGTVFVTIEDEHFYTQLILWPDVFQRYRNELKSHVIKASGQVSRWDGTANVIVSKVEPIEVPSPLPEAHDWH